MTLALLVSVITLLGAPLTMPLILHQAGAAAADTISPVAASIRLLALTSAALVGAMIARRWLPLDARGETADAATSLGLLVFGIGAMAGIRDVILADPDAALAALTVSFAAYLAAMLAGCLLFSARGWAEAFTAGLASASRNMGFVWAAAGLAAPPELYLFFACYMLPVHVMPLLIKIALSALRRRIANQA